MKVINYDGWGGLPRVSEERLELAISGELIIKWCGDVVAGKLTQDQLARYRQAQQNCFLVRKNKSSDYLVAMMWDMYCYEHAKPKVVVSERQKYAEVSLDSITANGGLVLSEQQLRKCHQRMLDNHVPLGSRIIMPHKDHTCAYIYVAKVPIENSKTLAAALNEIAAQEGVNA